MPQATTVAPTTNQRVLDFVNEAVQLMKPDTVVWCNGSHEEHEELINLMVSTGTAVRLNEEKKPDSIWVHSDPDDVARVEDRTFICTTNPEDTGPTNVWADPVEMKATLTKLYDGTMRGRTMYVVPFCMGPINAEDPKFGIELTDSPYVALSMGIMTRMGTEALRGIEAAGGDFVPCLHSVGYPLVDRPDVAWPCNKDKYIVHFPETREIWSYGSGYGGNALLGKKCYALRIASAMARDEGWLAEHMLILQLTSPENKTYHIAAAFPSACGKTNLAMLNPTIDGWKVKTLGDDIAWMRFGKDGRLYAVNPEAGFFGVAPGTSAATNPNAMKTIEGGHTVFTNVALTNDGDVWWEGIDGEAPNTLTDWHDHLIHPDKEHIAAHPNSRFCTPITQCPILADNWDDPQGVPIDAILFGGRRPTTVPLVRQARNWTEGVFFGSICSSETTAAAAGQVGIVRFDPMAMRPFIGYHVGDYMQHWLNIAQHDGAQLPQIFYVNWFRRGTNKEWLWPGFGDNARVLKWIVQRLENQVETVETPIGLLPNAQDLDVTGMDQDPALTKQAIAYDPAEWIDEIPRIQQWYNTIGERLPQDLRNHLETMEKALRDGQ